MKPSSTLIAVSLLIASSISTISSHAAEDMQVVVRARRLLTTNNFSGAERYLRSALKANPNNEHAWIMLGDIYRKQCTPAIVFGEDKGSDSCLNKALDCFSKALELNPNSAKAYIGLGEINCIDDNFNKAIKLANKSIAINPKEYKAYKIRGLAYAGLANYEQACRDLATFIENDADPDFRTINTKAQLDEKLGDYKNAYSTYKKLLIILDKKRVLLVEKDEIRLQIARCAFKIGKKSESLSIYTNMIKKKPNNYKAYLQRARFYKNQNQKALALKDYRKALSLKYSGPVMREMKACMK